MNKDLVLSKIELAFSMKSIVLDLSNLGLTSIPAAVSNIEWLEIINLSHNFIEDLQPIKELKKVRLVDARNNNITTIDFEILEMGLEVKWEYDYANDGIYLSGNPLSSPPVEIIKQGRVALEAYLNAVAFSKKQSASLSEAKIIVLGDGGVGKTSLIKMLLNSNNRLSFDETTTHGVEITTAKLDLDETKIDAKIWDFGGQQIYHATHQMFLTSRTLYILVIDARRDYMSDPEYWLNTIKTLVGYVPVIVVINKIDLNDHFFFDEKGLTHKYPNIISFKRTSCFTKEGILELFGEIKFKIYEYLLLRSEVPWAWIKIKERLESINQDYINYSIYKEICKGYYVYDLEEQNLLSNFLHDLGVIIQFKNLPLFSTLILNPFWIADAVSSIISAKEVRKNDGRIDVTILDSIFSPLGDKYPTSKIKFIIKVMKEFEMLFEKNENEFVIPHQLPSQEPEMTLSFGDSLSFFFSYNFLPFSLFPRVQYRIQKYIASDLIWRYGIIISEESSIAVVTKCQIDSKIEIRCIGPRKKELLFIIREMIKKINQSYLDLKVDEFIRIENDSKEVDFNILKMLQKEDEKTLFVPSIKKKVDIAGVLANFEPTNQNELSPIRIFISYSHKDRNYKEDLVSHLSPLIRLSEVAVWEDAQLIPGQEWRSEILIKLRESDLVLCLISSDFISSEFCYSVELSEALESHHRNEKIIIPVLIRKCFWHKLPIAKIQGVPNPPISSQKNIDEGWVDVISGVDSSLNMIRKQKYGT